MKAAIFALLMLAGAARADAPDAIFASGWQCTPPQAGLVVVVRNWGDLFPSPFGVAGPRLPYPGYLLWSQVGQTTLVDVLSLRIVAPQPIPGVNTYGQINQNLDNGQPFMFLSECPGDVTWSAVKTGCSRQGIDLNWRLAGFHEASGRCALEPGLTYYFNIGFLDGAVAQVQGMTLDRCGIGAGNHTCYWWGGPQLAGAGEPAAYGGDQ
jgi:hypothetical protein